MMSVRVGLACSLVVCLSFSSIGARAETQADERIHWTGPLPGTDGKGKIGVVTLNGVTVRVKGVTLDCKFLRFVDRPISPPLVFEDSKFYSNVNEFDPIAIARNIRTKIHPVTYHWIMTVHLLPKQVPLGLLSYYRKPWFGAFAWWADDPNRGQWFTVAQRDDVGNLVLEPRVEWADADWAHVEFHGWNAYEPRAWYAIRYLIFAESTYLSIDSLTMIDDMEVKGEDVSIYPYCNAGFQDKCDAAAQVFFERPPPAPCEILPYRPPLD
jgi:hypothetical protein